MKPKPGIQNLILIFIFTASRVRSQGCAEGAADSSNWPNCTAANTASCAGDIIFRCFYSYGVACPGNCMDNLNEQYRDAICWESYPGAGDGQCTAECVSVTAKNGSTFYPLGCNQNDTSAIASTALSTTTSILSGSATLSPAATTTTSAVSSTPKPNAGSSWLNPTNQEGIIIISAIAFAACPLW